MLISEWVRRIPDWDVPSKDNDNVCAKFKHRVFDEDFIKIPYRLFVPHVINSHKKIPLIVFLHGADVTGYDNEIHIRAHDIGAIYARDRWQALQSSIIFAPQYHEGTHWSHESVREKLFIIIERLIEEYECIDINRICIYGYSAGGMGVFKMLMQRPHFFYRAMIICGAVTSDDIDNLVYTPMWLFHAEDDNIVPCEARRGLGEYRYYGSAAVYDALHDKMQDDIRYTQYKAGELKEKYKINPHCSWVLASRNEEALRWLIGKDV